MPRQIGLDYDIAHAKGRFEEGEEERKKKMEAKAKKLKIDNERKQKETQDKLKKQKESETLETKVTGEGKVARDQGEKDGTAGSEKEGTNEEAKVESKEPEKEKDETKSDAEQPATAKDTKKEGDGPEPDNTKSISRSPQILGMLSLSSA